MSKVTFLAFSVTTILLFLLARKFINISQSQAMVIKNNKPEKDIFEFDLSRGIVVDWHLDTPDCPPMKSSCSSIQCGNGEYASLTRNQDGCSMCHCASHVEL